MSIESEIWVAKKKALLHLLENYFVLPSPKPDLDHIGVQLKDHEEKKPENIPVPTNLMAYKNDDSPTFRADAVEVVIEEKTTADVVDKNLQKKAKK